MFGTNDNFNLAFNAQNNKWTIMNLSWEEFQCKTTITESDLWTNDLEPSERNLFNAKLYSLIHFDSCKKENDHLNEFFWINLNKISQSSVNRWRHSLRLSLEDIVAIINLEKLFDKRRFIYNSINIDP